MSKKLLFMGLCMVNNVSITQKALYDTVGKTYDATRCADPEITQFLIKHLGAQADGAYIDVCCGSGNYTTAIYNQGINISGVDISHVMLEKARAKNKNINWLQGDAHKLPFEDASFDGALCINAIHHLGHLSSACKEIFRILKSGSKLVIFTATKEQCEKSWMLRYFPFIWDVGNKILTDEQCLTRTLVDSGFSSVTFEKFFVTPDTKDLYVYAGKYKPEIYLDQTVRDGMTPFNRPEFSHEIAAGLKELGADIKSGKVKEVIAVHEKKVGEGMFVVAEKR